MASEEVAYDETDVLEEEEDSDTEAPPPPKKMMGGSSPDDEEAGKGFMAVKPWIGAIVAPDGAPSVNPSAPSKGLELEWVYGYRAFDSKSNFVANTRGYFVYPVAALVVVYNKVKDVQQHFLGHTDDVRCLAQNPADKDWMVSGQNATIVDGRSTAPHVCVWNSTDFAQNYVLQFPVGSRAIRSVGFSPDGAYIAAVADDDNHTISIWNWKTKTQIASGKGDNNPIYQIKWTHVLGGAPGVYELTTVGQRHAFFHTFDAKNHSLKSKRITLGGAFPMQTFNTVTFSEKGHACLGGFDGNILICKAGTGGLASKAIPVSAKTGTKTAPKVFSLDTYQGGIVAGLSDKTVAVFDSKLTVIKTFAFNYKVTSVNVRGKDLLVGTQGSELYELKNGLDASVAGGSVVGRFEPLVQAHCDGELWASTFFPDGTKAISVGEDNQIFLWDLIHHKVLNRGIISSEKGGLAPKVKKASTTSLYPQHQCARAIALSPDTSHFVVGTNDGKLSIFKTSDLSQIGKQDLNGHGQRQVKNQEGNWIQTAVYSPDGNVLAVGTHGSVIVLLDAKNNYVVRGVIKSHHSFLTHMDFSADSSTLRSNDGAYELLFHDVEDPTAPKQITSASSLKNTQWASDHCPFTWGMVGVFVDNDGSEVNSVDRSPDGTLIAAADDHGKVNLLRYPAPEKGNAYHAYNGHSSHVTSVRFSADGKRLLTTGGHDVALVQWKVGEYQANPLTHQVM